MSRQGRSVLELVRVCMYAPSSSPSFNYCQRSASSASVYVFICLGARMLDADNANWFDVQRGEQRVVRVCFFYFILFYFC